MGYQRFRRGAAAALVFAAGLLLASCGGGGGADAGGGGQTGSPPVSTPGNSTPVVTPPVNTAPVRNVTSQTIATIGAPWAMAFLPDGALIVTERPPTGETVINPTEPGRLRLVTQAGLVSEPLAGLPANVGLLDVVLDPAFSQNGWIYISFMERDPAAVRFGRDAGDARIDPAGLAVLRARLTIQSLGRATLSNVAVIWRQAPLVVNYPGSGEPGGRLTFSPDGRYLFIVGGARQEFEPVQSLSNTLGKIVRIFPDGTIPADNPFVGREGARPEIWSTGHRNPYGLAFDSSGRLWSNEMGPRGGDELNLIRPGLNFGWPNVSYGDSYDGPAFVRPSAGDGFEPSVLVWTPVIAPAGMIFYSGSTFADWRGDVLIPGLQSRGLVRVRITGESASEVQRIDLGARIRAVAQGPDGAIWVLEDQPTGRLLKLSPVF